jgi:hypothetical protein
MQGYTWMIEAIAMDFSGIPGWGSVRCPYGTCMNSALSSFGCCPSLASTQTHIISYRYFSVKTVLSLAVVKRQCGRSSHCLVIIVDAIAIFVICIPNHLKLMVVPPPPKGRHFWIFPDSISLLPWVEISGCLTLTKKTGSLNPKEFSQWGLNSNVFRLLFLISIGQICIFLPKKRGLAWTARDAAWVAMALGCEVSWGEGVRDGLSEDGGTHGYTRNVWHLTRENDDASLEFGWIWAITGIFSQTYICWSIDLGNASVKRLVCLTGFLFALYHLYP